MTLYRNKINIMLTQKIHCNAKKSHNTVCARTALLKAAELVGPTVLMEAGSTMKMFEIQMNFDKSLYRASPSGCYFGLVF